jgi:hypothetical protein
MTFRLLLLAVAAMPLAACVPYPVHKTLQPAASVTVVDHERKPVQAAEVSLVANAYPYGHEKGRSVQLTGSDGLAQFPARREWRTEVIFIHGSEEFFWNWCVRKEGYVTFTTSHRSSKNFETELLVGFQLGQSTPCPKSFS